MGDTAFLGRPWLAGPPGAGLRLIRALVNASAANRTSMSAEIERRLERSFKRDPAHMDDALQELGRHILAAFEAGGRLENPELPAKEWMKNSVSYNRAIMRGFRGDAR